MVYKNLLEIMLSPNPEKRLTYSESPFFSALSLKSLPFKSSYQHEEFHSFPSK